MKANLPTKLDEKRNKNPSEKKIRRIFVFYVKL